ncbi:leucine-rich repeat domain-containing protein [Cryobacterium sp. Y62]|uniref:leucine-rich repeat domain-containing protein n=1 Tax=Cryobacterium sp. Y62 TaxID=2048284 RepID=UPI001304816C|nr:leucine-rich repeat domain-containing protein [Cryobacterium sp. Y62]
MSTACSSPPEIPSGVTAASFVGLPVTSHGAPTAGAFFTAHNGITYAYGTEDGTVTAVGYNGPSTVVVPETVSNGVDEYLVTAVADEFFSSIVLDSVSIGENVTSIGSWCFVNDNLTTIVFANTLTNIGQGAFAGNALTTVDIPESVTTVNDGAFASNPLTSVKLREGLTEIGAYAFEQTELTSISIPASMTTIGRGAFSGAPLTSATFAGAAPSIHRSLTSDTPTFDAECGLVVHYLSQFGVEGGFTSPTWLGYDSVIDPIVSFELNGHGTTGEQRLVAGNSPGQPVDPEAANVVFCGWYRDAALTVPFDFTATVTDDVTVFAKWAANPVAT